MSSRVTYITAYVPPAQHDALQEAAAEAGLPLGRYCAMLLTRYARLVLEAAEVQRARGGRGPKTGPMGSAAIQIPRQPAARWPQCLPHRTYRTLRERAIRLGWLLGDLVWECHRWHEDQRAVGEPPDTRFLWEHVGRTWRGDAVPAVRPAILHAAMGLAGEAGEVLDEIKKAAWKPGRGLDRIRLQDELGDVGYYWAALVAELGLDPVAVMIQNRQKLMAGRHGWPEHGKGGEK